MLLQTKETPEIGDWDSRNHTLVDLRITDSTNGCESTQDTVESLKAELADKEASNANLKSRVDFLEEQLSNKDNCEVLR